MDKFKSGLLTWEYWLFLSLSLSPPSVLHRAVQRQDIPTVTHLIRLGADPLLRNTFNSSSAQMLALKCFPPSHFSDKLEEKGTVYVPL